MRELRIYESQGTFYVQEKRIEFTRYGFLWLKKRADEVWHTLDMNGYAPYDYRHQLWHNGFPMPYLSLEAANEAVCEFIKKDKEKIRRRSLPDVIHPLPTCAQ